MDDSTTVTSKPEDKKGLSAQTVKKPDQAMDLIRKENIRANRVGFFEDDDEFSFERREVPPSFEAKEIVQTPVPEYIEKASFSGSISFTKPKEEVGTQPVAEAKPATTPVNINITQGVSEIAQGAVKVTESAVSMLGGATQETFGAGVDLFKMVIGGPVEINSAKSAEDNKKKQEKAANLANTRAFLEDLTARQQKVRMEERMQMALRIIETPNVSEEDAKLLGMNANVDKADHLMNQYGLNSLAQKRSALQVAQMRQIQQQKMAESKAGSKMAVHADAAMEGGKGKGSQNMSAMNAGG